MHFLSYFYFYVNVSMDLQRFAYMLLRLKYQFIFDLYKSFNNAYALSTNV